MKSLFSSFRILVLAAALLVLRPFTVSAETFTEGVRVSPETVKLKTGEYIWEPERAPEGPLLIVASTTEQAFCENRLKLGARHCKRRNSFIHSNTK